MPLRFPWITALVLQQSQSHQTSIELQDFGQFTSTFRLRLASQNCGSSVLTKRPSPSRCLLPSKSVHPSTTPPRWTTSVQYHCKTGRFYVTSSRAGIEGVKQVTKRAKLVYKGKRRGVLCATEAERHLERKGQRTRTTKQILPRLYKSSAYLLSVVSNYPLAFHRRSSAINRASVANLPPSQFLTSQRRPYRTEARCQTTRSELSTSRSSKMSSSRRASTSRRVVLMNMSLRS
jgi:hypothetical protein